MQNFHQQEHLPALESKSKKLPWLFGGLALSAICVLFLCGILTFVYAVNFARNSPRQGVAPAHGVKVIFRVQGGYGKAPSRQEMQQTIDILEHRARAYGLKSYAFEVSDANHIVAKLPSDGQPGSLMRKLSQTGLIEFVDMGEETVADGEVIVTDFRPWAPIQAGVKAHHTILTGDQIKSASVAKDTLGQFMVSLEFDAKSAGILSEHTKNNVGKYLAITLDKRVISSPSINSPITDGSAIIEGAFTQESAETLATYMRHMALPVSLEIIDDSVY